MVGLLSSVLAVLSKKIIVIHRGQTSRMKLKEMCSKVPRYLICKLSYMEQPVPLIRSPPWRKYRPPLILTSTPCSQTLRAHEELTNPMPMSPVLSVQEG